MGKRKTLQARDTLHKLHPEADKVKMRKERRRLRWERGYKMIRGVGSFKCACL